MLCEKCKWGLIRLVGIDDDINIFRLTCLIDGADMDGPPLECNRFSMENKMFKGVLECFHY